MSLYLKPHKNFLRVIVFVLRYVMVLLMVVVIFIMVGICKYQRISSIDIIIRT